MAAARADRRAARMALLPVVDVAAPFDVTRVRRFTTTDVFGGPAERQEAFEATSRGATQGVFLDWTLFDGGRALAGARAAGARQRAAEADLEATWSELRAWVAGAYFGVLEERRALDVERAILEARRRDVETTERLLPVVGADLVDVLGARVELFRQEAAVAAAEEAASAAMLELAHAVGTGLDPRLPLRIPFEPFDPDSLDVDRMVRDALDAHPEIRALAAQAEAARIEAGATGWLARLPVVAASASYVRSEFGGSERPFLELDPRDEAVSFGLGLQLPLFDRFALDAERGRARAVAADRRAELTARRLEAETRVRSQLLDLRSGWRSLVIETQAAEMARQRAGLARDQYEIGAIDFVRLQRVLDDATEAERALVRRRFAFYRALVELEREVGRAVAPGQG